MALNSSGVYDVMLTQITCFTSGKVSCVSPFRPVIIEVPHFASLRGREREVIVLRSDNGETWKEHTVDSSEDAIYQALGGSFEGEGDFLFGAPSVERASFSAC